ncbi:Dolichyl-phosphate-mannose-protein mannosyltransferase [Bhargavaea ginsengi]|uniref:Dolichyl-phosphate-mannose-protein mannosyltransferase n=1 Tax=Bhargavaea ginsengi TaxID=426757 RepID=A0A1H7AGC4_9BACL|nr:phospholipid carrier-dependent glycosyltransferase [Bhargavaea ginsengi]SEJ62927.1 Dolichyl-phosphate-mannose-protein mannosyltransferase [Bhargavaea ginsengi]
MSKIVTMLKKHLIFIVFLSVYAIVNLFFLNIHPGSIYNEPERFGEGISTYGSRDAALYSKMAWQLINEGVYGYEHGPDAQGSNAYVTYGQPFYLTAIFKTAELFNTNHLMLYRLANMFLSLGIAILIYTISYKLFSNRWISNIAAILYMSHIAPLHYFRAALTEIPSMFLLLLSILFFIVALRRKDWKWHVAFGIIASLMLMFRATPAPMLLFGWFIVVARYGWKDGIKTGFIWCIGPLLVMAPWVARNLIQFGEAYLFSSHAGGPLLAGANPFNFQPHSELMAGASEAGMTQEEYAQHLIAEGFSTNFPLWFSWFTVGKTFWLFFDQNMNPDGLGPYAQTFTDFWKGFFKWQNILLVFTGLISAFLCRKHKPVLFLSVLILIYIVSSNIFLAIPRYGLLVMPILTIIAAYGLVTFVGFLTGKWRTRKMNETIS